MRCAALRWQVLLKRLEADSVVLVPAAGMALYGSDVERDACGLVVEVGYSHTTVLPVCCGQPLLHSSTMAQLGTHVLHRWLHALAREVGVPSDGCVCCCVARLMPRRMHYRMLLRDAAAAAVAAGTRTHAGQGLAWPLLVHGCMRMAAAGASCQAPVKRNTQTPTNISLPPPCLACVRSRLHAWRVSGVRFDGVRWRARVRRCACAGLRDVRAAVMVGVQSGEGWLKGMEVVEQEAGGRW